MSTIIQILIDLLAFCVEIPLGVLWKVLLNRQGIAHFIYVKGLGSKILLEDLVLAFKGAVDIKMAVGEIDHHLMENRQVLDGIIYACEHNHASIEILHGPRVDPKTKTIFELANSLPDT